MTTRDRAREAIAKAISPQRWAHLNAGEESRELAEAERLLVTAEAKGWERAMRSECPDCAQPRIVCRGDGGIRCENCGLERDAARLFVDATALADQLDAAQRATDDAKAKARREALRWQSIETAPRDGTVFDVWLGNAGPAEMEFYCSPGSRRSPDWSWRDGKFRSCTGLMVMTVFVQPTHWMPLALPPE